MKDINKISETFKTFLMLMLKNFFSVFLTIATNSKLNETEQKAFFSMKILRSVAILWYYLVYIYIYICGALRNLVPFAEFQKCEKISKL